MLGMYGRVQARIRWIAARSQRLRADSSQASTWTRRDKKSPTFRWGFPGISPSPMSPARTSTPGIPRLVDGHVDAMVKDVLPRSRRQDLSGHPGLRMTRCL